ncbi:MAG: DUF4251 domain-containing protein [Bacteroidota bacterium]|nr:DUF4251 domain-containing protein [Bacteroidota bacterium]
MKPGIISLLIAAFILAGCSASSSTAKKEKAAADYENTAALIESGNYMFTIRSASPSGGRTIQITSHYALKAAEGTYEAYLPYFGRAYSGAYGDSGGIEFNGEPENLTITRDDNKMRISVNFAIQSEKDKYTVSLDVSSSGMGILVIASQKRQSISYAGQCGELKD